MDTLLKLEAEERTKEILKKNLEELRKRIASACARSGHQPSSIKLVVATKTVEPPVIRILRQLGISEIGENKVQDAQRKHEALKDLPLHWHMFGHLQRNKVKKALQLFELIHSLDSLPLAQEIDRVSLSLGKRTAVLVEANVSKEPQKYGLKEEDLPSFLERLSPMKGLQVLGLMTMTPVMEDPEPCRPFFRRLRELSEEIKKQGIEDIRMEYLSMGMTQDFEVAIEEGSNLIRVGTAIFRGI
jgi:pyridoxal phosphate enzyme (YggS family)